MELDSISKCDTNSICSSIKYKFIRSKWNKRDIISIINCIRTPELEENEAIRKIWQDFNPVTNKRRRTYRKDIQ